jgi:hypothetical protein
MFDFPFFNDFLFFFSLLLHFSLSILDFAQYLVLSGLVLMTFLGKKDIHSSSTGHDVMTDI